MIKTISDYILKHEKLIIVASVILAVVIMFNKLTGYRASKADADAVAAQAVLQQQEQTVKNLTEQLQQQEANTAVVVQQIDAQVAGYQSLIASLQKSLDQQEQKAKVEPLPELTLSWNNLIQIPDGVESTTQGITVSEPAARATVSQLVQVPVLVQQNQDESKQLTLKDTEIESQAKVIKDSDALVSGLKAQIVDGQKACTTEIAQVKADARKGKLKWFEIGYVVGLATRGVIKIFSGV